MKEVIAHGQEEDEAQGQRQEADAGLLVAERPEVQSRTGDSDDDYELGSGEDIISHEPSELRDYQLAAVEAAIREWEDVQSTLICLPTGAGKTICAAEIIKRFAPKRTLFLVHRGELAWQSASAITRHTGLECQIEMAENVASVSPWHRTPVVVATIQTLVSGVQRRRMERFKPEDFGLVVCDESHHSVSPSWKLVIDYFKSNSDLKVLNLTATPDRHDQEALGQIIDTVAYDFEIVDAIREGWLTPIEQTFVSVESLDYSHVRTTAGDLNGADLAAILEVEQNLQGMVGAAIKLIGDRRTIVFTATVKQAEMACEIFNRHKSEMACWICGATKKDVRKYRMDAFRKGDYQVLVNVGICTEGVDVPEAEVCVMGRPTKSRSFYAQCVGRILRPLRGLVDGIGSAEERREAIAQSAKPVASVIDFAGNAGKHLLVSTADLLGGKVSDAAVQLAMRKAVEIGQAARMDILLDEAEEELRAAEEAEKERVRKLDEARRVRLVAKVTYSSKTIDPFNAFELTPAAKERAWNTGRILSDKQRQILSKQGIDPDTLSYSQGRQIVSELFRRWDKHLCTAKQAKLLRRFGYETRDLPMADASILIDALAKNGWRKPSGADERPAPAQPR